MFLFWRLLSQLELGENELAKDGSAISTSATGRKSSIKDPDAALDYSFDWTDWLAEVGDTISTASVTVNDGDATVPLSVDHVVIVNGIVTIFISGGELGKQHDIRCRIETTNTPARADERTLTIKVRDR